MRPQRFARCLVGASILVAAGCGGGSGSTPPAPPAFSTFQAASVVIGQADFVSGDSNGGGPGPDAGTLSVPHGNAALAGGVLYLPDSANNRVLGFNGVPASNGVAADFVLGQPDFTTPTAATAANGMAVPQTAVAAEGKLFAVEYDNNRVLVWDTIPSTDGAAADGVVGQSDFTSNVMDCSDTRLKHPESIAVAGGKLIVADSDNNRVLIWDTIPTVPDTPADLVLGQQTFGTCTRNDDDQDGVVDLTPTQRTLFKPTGVWSDGTRLVVSDTLNNRVLVWTSFPAVSFAPANLVLGQDDFESDAENDSDQDGAPDTPSAATFRHPTFLTSDGTRLFVADSLNNRVLVWNSFPASNFAPADVVLGQRDFTDSTANDDDGDGGQDATPSARTLWAPGGLHVSGTRLFVADSENSRWLVFNAR